MLEPSTWSEVAHRLAAADFAHRQHQLIFEAIAKLAGADLPTDSVKVFAALEDTGKAGLAGGVSYLAELVESTPNGSVAGYAEVVREKARERRQIARSGTVVPIWAAEPRNR